MRPLPAAFTLSCALAACGGAPPAPAGSAAAPALPAPAPGWGAVFHREGAAVQLGGGPLLVGPRGVGPGTPGGNGACGGILVSGGPAHAVLALPAAVQASDDPARQPQRPFANPAAVVEAAAWRIDEALPAADRFSPQGPEQSQPARQRGVELGSVVKVRRYGGPPVLVASGVRDCNGVLAILDDQAKTRLDALPIPGACAVGRVLPPADLDGDGALETAFFSEDTVLLARLDLNAAAPKLLPLGAWQCPR
ncbi:MAG: hypothetical protein JNM72_10660 [Deltaproteobacteria bacterium]|nr:hypothetical protein [Deltaproteobacteria bacterium]